VEEDDASNLAVQKQRKVQRINAKYTAEVAAVLRTDVPKVQKARRIGVWHTVADGAVRRRIVQKVLLGKQENVKLMAEAGGAKRLGVQKQLGALEINAELMEAAHAALIVLTGLIHEAAIKPTTATAPPASSASFPKTHGAKSFMLTQKKFVYAMPSMRSSKASSTTSLSTRADATAHIGGALTIESSSAPHFFAWKQTNSLIEHMTQKTKRCGTMTSI
jgi:hypothetical protein